MKPALEHLPRETDQSFVVKYFDYSFYPTPWHYHPEYEIVLVTESTGTRFIGDHITDFKPGDLAFIGPNIPHTYRNEDSYYEAGSTQRAKSIVIHFTEESLGRDFLSLPEAKPVLAVLKRSLSALEVTGETNKRISQQLVDIVSQSGLKRWLSLVDILNELAWSSEVAPITQTTQVGYNEKESKRLCHIFDWVTENFQRNIKLSEAAHIAGMNENAFSRFFSLRTRKTFSSFVQELRLKKAAELLVDNNMTITEVCYECGYNNISNFNRQFLHYYQMNPLKYRQAFLKKL
ncbi:MAG: AraC family transcriptional regulator [Bacteroidetes bacterium]|nr:AraC family transcriptional regulator [Bacteroidota bacterium]